MQRLVLAILVVLAIAPAARAEVIWRGDFENGDVTQWSNAEEMSPDRLKVVQDPVREGRYALEATVIQGDDPIHASGNRNELVFTDDDVQDQERYYGWSTMWPADYASEPTWQLFTQWHHENGGGSPPLEFYVNGETVFLRASGQVLWQTPLERAKWHDFVLHVKWSVDGWVELFYDGQQVLPRTPAKTLFAGQGAYLKQGLYRDKKIAEQQHIFHDGMTVGTTEQDVAQFLDHSGGGTAAQSGGGLSQGSDGSSVNVQAGGCDQAGLATTAPALLVGLVAFLMPRRRRALAPVKARR